MCLKVVEEGAQFCASHEYRHILTPDDGGGEMSLGERC